MNDLAKEVNIFIKGHGYKKTWIAEQAGLTRQGFNQLLCKKNFSTEDADAILSIIGYKTEIKIVKSGEGICHFRRNNENIMPDMMPPT